MDRGVPAPCTLTNPTRFGCRQPIGSEPDQPARLDAARTFAPGTTTRQHFNAADQPRYAGRITHVVKFCCDIHEKDTRAVYGAGISYFTALFAARHPATCGNSRATRLDSRNDRFRRSGKSRCGREESQNGSGSDDTFHGYLHFKIKEKRCFKLWR